MPKLLRNAFSSGSAWLASVALGLILTPFYIRWLGVEAYGLFVLIGGLSGYVTFIDFGMGQSLVKFVSEGLAAERPSYVRMSVQIGIVLHAAGSLVAASVIFALSESLASWLSVSQGLRAASVLSFKIAAAGLFGTMGANLCSGIINGFQRYDVTAKISAGTAIAMNLATVGALMMGGDLIVATLIYVVFMWVQMMILLYETRKLLPERGLWRIQKIGLQELLEITRYSGFLFLSRLAASVRDYLYRFLIGILLGPAAIAYYVVPTRAVTALSGFLNSASNIFLPHSSELLAQQKADELGRSVINAMSWFVGMSLPLYVSLAVFSQAILRLWIDPSFAETAWPVLSVLAFGYMIASWTMIPTNVFLGSGRSKFVSSFSVLSAVLTLILVYPFSQTWGITGAALVVPLIQFPAAYFIWYFANKLLHISLPGYLRKVYAEPVLGVLVSSLVALAAYSFLQSQAVMSTYLAQIVTMALFLLVYYALFLRKRLTSLLKGRVHLKNGIAV